MSKQLPDDTRTNAEALAGLVMRLPQTDRVLLERLFHIAGWEGSAMAESMAEAIKRAPMPHDPNILPPLLAVHFTLSQGEPQ